ncbi:MAG: hypothetical protein ABJB21_10865 [bacterium]
MTSKKSRAAAAATKGEKASNNDSSQMSQPADGVLFPMTPDNVVPDSKSEERKPGVEELLLPSHNEAKTLCNLAAEIKALAPWQWMEETDVFGVENPDTGEIGFISIMGNVGEYEAVAVYPGAEGIYGFIDFQADPSATPDRLIEIPQLQLSFSESKFLEKRDRELLKGSGIKFTGRKPLFRSYRPGYLPWFITLSEARLLIHALAQTLEVTKRFADQPVALPADGDGETVTFLVRVPRKENASSPEGISREDISNAPDTSQRENRGQSPLAGLVWEDQIKLISRPALPPIDTTIDWLLLSDLKSIPQSAMQLEVDVFIGPGSIGEPHERPLALYILIIADRYSGFILGFKALTAEDSLNSMYANVPETIADLLWQNKALPKQIIVRSELLFNLLEPLEKELKIQIRRANELPAIDEAAGSLAQYLQTGKI